MRGAHFVPIGIPTMCRYNMVPNLIKYCPGDRIRHRIHSDMTICRLWSEEVKTKHSF